MCSRCKNTGTIIVKFPGVTKQCNCGCSDGGDNTPPNPNYLIKPEGGVDGNVIVKQGDKVIWAFVSSLHVEPIYSTQISD